MISMKSCTYSNVTWPDYYYIFSSLGYLFYLTMHPVVCQTVGTYGNKVWQQLFQQVFAEINFETAPCLCRHLENPVQTLEAMLRPKVATLPGHIQAVYVQNAAKLFATVLKSQEGNTESTEAQETSQLMIDRLPLFVQSANLEVQERVKFLFNVFFFNFYSNISPL